MNGRMAKAARRKARELADKEAKQMVPEFKKFVNTQFKLRERIVLAWRILWKVF